MVSQLESLAIIPDMKFIKYIIIGVVSVTGGVSLSPCLHAGPYYYGGWRGYQDNCYDGYRGWGNGGWFETGLPNGLGWTLFGLGAASVLGATTLAANFEEPIYSYPALQETEYINSQNCLADETGNNYYSFDSNLIQQN